ncbi:MAG: UrcA family protein [Oceanicaulis sp.]|nr:UrcA family protein [Oceanicaulis sp.]
MPRIQALMITAAAAFALNAPAHAQEFKFEYQPWQLSSSEGRAEVLNQLERRVRTYCDAGHARTLLQRRIAADCQERTLARAVEQIGDAHVLALHQQRRQTREA